MGAAGSSSANHDGYGRGLVHLSREVVAADGWPVAVQHFVHEGSSLPHDHEFVEIFLVVAGRGKQVWRDGEQRLAVGDFGILPPRQWHWLVDCAALDLVNCFVGPELLDGPLGYLEHDVGLLGALRSGARAGALGEGRLGHADIEAALAELSSIGGEAPGRGSPASALGHLLIYLDILDRAWRPSLAGQRPEGAPHPEALRAMDLLEGDLGHPWTLDELAAALGLDAGHLGRIFRASVGLPPIAYLNRRRMQAASALLVQSDLPVTLVGRQVGCSDPAYFARRFRAEFGTSPSAYRSRLRSGTLGPSLR